MRRTTGTRLALAALIMVTASSCSDEVVPDAAGIEAEYKLTACLRYTGTTHAPPCNTLESGHGTGKVDSASVVLHRDHSFRWKAATTESYNACYLEFKSCYTYDTTLAAFDGTYTISGDTIHLGRFSASDFPHRLMASMPPRVSSTWTGPDSVSYPYYTVETWIFTRR